MKMEAEIGMKLPKNHGMPRSTAVTINNERMLPWRLQRKHVHAGTLVSDFNPSEL